MRQAKEIIKDLMKDILKKQDKLCNLCNSCKLEKQTLEAVKNCKIRQKKLENANRQKLNK